MRIPANPDVIANKVSMLRTQYDGAVLLVEGSSDALLYLKFIDSDRCKIFDAECRRNVVDALVTLEERDCKNLGMVGIIDADFDHVVGAPPPKDNIFRTDTRDLETLILSTESFDEIIREFGNHDRVKSHCEQSKLSVRDFVVQQALIIGILRLISHMDNLSLRFSGLDFSKFVDQGTGCVQIQNLLQTVKNLSQKPSLDTKLIAQKVSTFNIGDIPVWQICCGHDIVSLLVICFRRALGNKSPTEINQEKIEICMRASYRAESFTKTKLFNLMLDWEKNNPDYRVLLSSLSAVGI